MIDSIDRQRRSVLAASAALATTSVLSVLTPPFARATDASTDKRSRLILLGTAGGPTPKALRAAPANAIVVDGATYVVDCGNGVARQMALAGLDVGSIRDVFLTHQHSDHNADLGNLLLLAWAANLRTPVDLWGPPPLERMLRQFLAMNDVDIGIRIKDEGRPTLAPLLRPHELTGAGVVMQDANVKVTAALVEHPPMAPAFAYRFDCPDRSIVFSGDTRPTPQLVELARGADVLVHEVMYLPALEQLIAGESHAKRLRQHLLDSHTSTAQVGRIATEAGVKTLVLSHFVPGGDPALTDAIWRDAVAPYFKGQLIVGRDLMEL